MNKKFYDVLVAYCTKNKIGLVKEDDNEFYFTPSKKQIHLGKEEIEDLESLYKAFHEASHSTAVLTGRNIDNYALEEVVADMTASNILSRILHLFDTKEVDENNYSEKLVRLKIMNTTYSSSWALRVLNDSKISYEDLMDYVKVEIQKNLELFKDLIKEEK